LVDNSAPVKYGARLTAVPLIIAGARIPGTVMPTFGLVSVKCQRGSRMGDSRLTVANDGSVDNESQ
jgi:hypothetical protein